MMRSIHAAKRLDAGLTLWILALFLFSGCTVRDSYQGALYLHGEHTILPEQILNGTVIVGDATVVIEPGARLSGPVYILLGDLELDGTVTGDVYLMTGRLALGPEAVVSGELNNAGGDLAIHPDALVRQVNTSRVQLPSAPIWTRHSLLDQFGWLLGEMILVAVLAYLLERFLPVPMERVQAAARKHPLVSASMGLLSGIVALLLLAMMVFTLFLIPLAVLGVLAGVAIVLYSQAALGALLGGWLAGRARLNWARPVIAAFGGVLFPLVLEIIGFIPFAGDLVNLLVLVVGIGAVLLTRLGIRTFVPAGFEGVHRVEWNDE